MTDLANVELLNYEQAAQFLGVCQKTVKTWKKQGRIPWTKLGKRTVRIPRAALMRVIEAETTAAVA